jgi:PadR family transcriptional regulator PadR
VKKTESLGHFEQLVLTAVLALRQEAYGAAIHTKVSDLAGVRSVNLGSVYVTLDRLQDKGYLTSWFAGASPERSGKARRYFKLEALGEKALREALDTGKRISKAAEDSWRLGKWKPSRVKR